MQHYSLYKGKEEYGLYHSRRPVCGAKKVFKSICKNLDVDEAIFEIINIMTKQTYKYYGKRKKIPFDEQKSVMHFTKFNEKRIFIKKHEYKLIKVNDYDCKDDKSEAKGDAEPFLHRLPAPSLGRSISSSSSLPPTT